MTNADYTEPEWVDYSTGFTWRDDEQMYGEYRLFLAGLDYYNRDLIKAIRDETQPKYNAEKKVERALAVLNAWGTPNDPEGKVRPTSDYSNLGAAMAKELRYNPDEAAYDE